MLLYPPCHLPVCTRKSGLGCARPAEAECKTQTGEGDFPSCVLYRDQPKLLQLPNAAQPASADVRQVGRTPISVHVTVYATCLHAAGVFVKVVPTQAAGLAAAGVKGYEMLGLVRRDIRQ
jgi:hypothetical protein